MKLFAYVVQSTLVISAGNGVEAVGRHCGELGAIHCERQCALATLSVTGKAHLHFAFLIVGRIFKLEIECLRRVIAEILSYKQETYIARRIQIILMDKVAKEH